VSLEQHLGKGPDPGHRSLLVVHAPILAPAIKGGNLGREDEEQVLDANPASNSPGAALGNQMQGPGMEN